ncbi:MAG: tetratricopeptide repeat protein [Candidatus Poribacteria bacterium]
MRPIHFIFLIFQLFAWQIVTEFSKSEVTSEVFNISIERFTEDKLRLKTNMVNVLQTSEPNWYMVNAAMDISSSAKESSSNLESLINQGLFLTYSGQYKEAEERYKRIINLYPKNPAGYYYLAALYQTIMRNYRVRDFEPQFEKFIDLAIKIGKEAIANDGNNAAAYMYFGNARGHRGVHRINQQKFFQGFIDGLKGASYLRKSIELDPTLYDAYYGTGIYQYWRSAKSKSFWFLPFIGDNRRKGIDEIKLSIQKGKHSEIEGKYALVSIYYNEKNYERAYQLNQQLCQLFPDNPAAIYMKGLIEEKRGKWQEAQQTFQKLLSLLLASKYRSLGYQAECHYRIAFLLSKQGQFKKAVKECEIALKLWKQRDASKELEDALSSTKDLLKEARKLHEELLERQSSSKP